MLSQCVILPAKSCKMTKMTYFSKIKHLSLKLKLKKHNSKLKCCKNTTILQGILRSIKVTKS